MSPLYYRKNISVDTKRSRTLKILEFVPSICFGIFILCMLIISIKIWYSVALEIDKKYLILERGQYNGEN
jgi:ABC-type phosphate transport system permease subunit